MVIKKTIYNVVEIDGITIFNNELIHCAAEGCPRVPECAAIGEYICESKK